MVSCRFLPGIGFLVVQNVALVAEAVHFHARWPSTPISMIVILALDAVFADDVALVEARELRRVQFRFADFAHVPDHVRRQPIARIKPVLHANHFELGKRDRRLYANRRTPARPASVLP